MSQQLHLSGIRKIVNIKKIIQLQISEKTKQGILIYDHEDSNFPFSPNVNPSTLSMCLARFIVTTFSKITHCLRI